MMTALFAALAVVASAPPAAAMASLPACKDQLSLGLDGENGAFDGMSQTGVLLVVRNLGPAACRTPGLPRLIFEDAAGRPLAIARRSPPGLHPGPMIPPVAIAPGAEATTALHWVDGDVYDGHNCKVPARLVATLGTQTAALPWTARFCGPAGAPIPFDQPPLKTDPQLRETRTAQ